MPISIALPEAISGMMLGLSVSSPRHGQCKHSHNHGTECTRVIATHHLKQGMRCTQDENSSEEQELGTVIRTMHLHLHDEVMLTTPCDQSTACAEHSHWYSWAMEIQSEGGRCSGNSPDEDTGGGTSVLLNRGYSTYVSTHFVNFPETCGRFSHYNTAFNFCNAMSVLTVEQFKVALPDKVKKSVNQELIDQINQTLSDPDMYEAYRDNLLSYTQVMQDGRFKVTDYVNAVKYVSHKLMGASNLQAYIKTFPDKYQRFKSQGVADKDIASYVTAYNKSKLVNLIMEQTLIPAWVLNQDLYQKAINKQAELMMTARSEKVQSDAAAHLMNALKPPEVKKVELDIGMKEDSSIAALRASTLELARQQRLMVEAGAMNAQQVAHSKLVGQIIDVESKEVK